ncbi:hypothetical protein HJC23_009953 [Cyclotella cryptica]|uniref:Plastid lipid-associated protein/fibrillin conserved domain-containing protein n=1 Tax=Cyclotella cryptica TaxID=29204 RepID=A0ABD3Q8I0_9STRA|eukprot:CCRYP_007710-RA/>CCRYP_007710-RA protein AED:0.33 eAED:0.33 QI:45/1/1/1/0.5/0.4/5/882/508
MTGQLQLAAISGLLLTTSRLINALHVPRLISFPCCSSISSKVPSTLGRGLLYASSADTDDIDTSDDDMEEFLNDLVAEARSDSATTQTSFEDLSENEASPKQDSSYFIQRQQAVGIGGNSGFVYDVNALKRNLVQESVRGCKQELLTLLGDGREYNNIRDVKSQRAISVPRSRKGRDDLIEERLAALVQANPVSTTTDSNLLDGEWSFAFATNSASKILDTSRFLLSKSKRKQAEFDKIKVKSDNLAFTVRGGPWRFKSGKTENPFRSSTRQIFLENLSDDEDAHIVDETSILGGLYHIRQRYGVFGLTRTALDLDLMESETRFLGIPFQRKSTDDFKGTKYGAPLEVQILYLDTDLCICTTGLGLEGPLHVYTKSDLWVSGGAKRKLRLLARTASWVSTLQSPFRIRQKMNKLFARNKPRATTPDSVLKALNIGELNINEDGTTKEDASWDGEDDPFYHLNANERMEVLKTMSLQDIYQAALNRKTQNKKEKRRWASREKQFKRPEL